MRCPPQPPSTHRSQYSTAKTPRPQPVPAWREAADGGELLNPLHKQPMILWFQLVQGRAERVRYNHAAPRPCIEGGKQAAVYHLGCPQQLPGAVSKLITGRDRGAWGDHPVEYSQGRMARICGWVSGGGATHIPHPASHPEWVVGVLEMGGVIGGPPGCTGSDSRQYAVLAVYWDV